MREDERTWERKVPAVLLFVANLPTANIVATSAVLPPAFVLAAVILAAVPFAVPVAPPPPRRRPLPPRCRPSRPRPGTSRRPARLRPVVVASDDGWVSRRRACSATARRTSGRRRVGSRCWVRIDVMLDYMPNHLYTHPHTAQKLILSTHI